MSGLEEDRDRNARSRRRNIMMNMHKASSSLGLCAHQNHPCRQVENDQSDSDQRRGWITRHPAAHLLYRQVRQGTF